MCKIFNNLQCNMWNFLFTLIACDIMCHESVKSKFWIWSEALLRSSAVKCVVTLLCVCVFDAAPLVFKFRSQLKFYFNEMLFAFLIPLCSHEFVVVTFVDHHLLVSYFTVPLYYIKLREIGNCFVYYNKRKSICLYLFFVFLSTVPEPEFFSTQFLKTVLVS